MTANAAGAVVNLGLLVLLMPGFGLMGALVITRFCDGVYLMLLIATLATFRCAP